MYRDITEPIEVMAVFSRGQIKPLSFKWRQRVYKIRTVTQRWHSPSGKYKIHHFGVMDTQDNFFELCYSESDYNWTVAQTWS
jgi:hypothetical protein